MSSRSTPPPAQNLTILAGDLLCVEVHRLIDEVANFRSYHRYAELRQALSTYTEARFDGILNHTEPSETFKNYIRERADPQRCTVDTWEPAPTTQRSAQVHQ